MKKILLSFALTAAVMTAGAQVKELEPDDVFELSEPEEINPEDGDDGPQDCFPVTNIKATSRLASQGANNYNEKNLYDEDFKTSWVEGVKGYGIGEKITFTLEDVTAGFMGINIVNGYSKSPTAWKNNSRVKKLKLSVDGEPKFILNLKDQMGGQYFDIGNALFKDRVNEMHNYTVTFEILDVYEGDKYDDTAITSIGFGSCY